MMRNLKLISYSNMQTCFFKPKKSGFQENDTKNVATNIFFYTLCVHSLGVFACYSQAFFTGKYSFHFDDKHLINSNENRICFKSSELWWYIHIREWINVLNRLFCQNNQTNLISHLLFIHQELFFIKFQRIKITQFTGSDFQWNLSA